MKNIRNDYCIRMFCGYGDKYRPHFEKVHFENGNLYATDAHSVAKISAARAALKYGAADKFPKVENVINEHKSVETKTFKTDDLFQGLMAIECIFRPKMKDCDDCNGEGTTVCHCCKNAGDCKYCEGIGKVPGERLELVSARDCKLFGKYYNITRLDKVLRTAVICGVDEIKVSNAEGYSGTMFYVGDFEILLMPVRFGEE